MTDRKRSYTSDDPLFAHEFRLSDDLQGKAPRKGLMHDAKIPKGDIAFVSTVTGVFIGAAVFDDEGVMHQFTRLDEKQKKIYVVPLHKFTVEFPFPIDGTEKKTVWVVENTLPRDGEVECYQEDGAPLFNIVRRRGGTIGTSDFTAVSLVGQSYHASLRSTLRRFVRRT